MEYTLICRKGRNKASNWVIRISLQNNEVKKLFHKLSQFIITPTESTSEELKIYGFKTIRRKEKTIDDSTLNPLIIIEGEEYKTYQKLCNLISLEPNAEHLSDRDIDNLLSNFVYDILSHSKKFKNPKKLKKKVVDTIEEFLQPFTEWCAIAPIEGMSIPNKSIKIGTSEIRKFNKTDKQTYFGETNRAFSKSFDKKFLDHTCVVVKLQSNNKKSAVDKGRKKISLVLDSIRAGIGTNQFCCLAEPVIVASNELKSQKGMVQIKYPRRLRCQLTKTEVENFSELIQIMGNIIDNEKPLKIQKRILRSLQTLSRSVKDNEPEDKISKLFTSLETVLIPERKKLKGETLACRIALLQARLNGKFTHPDRTLYLYEKRSEIVHGSDYNRPPPTNQDVSSLEHLARLVLPMVCKAVSTERFSSIKQFLCWLENNDDLKRDLYVWIQNNCKKVCISPSESENPSESLCE